MKVKRKKLFVLMLAAVLLLAPVSAFADGKTVNVNGYEDVGMDKNTISVSNVTKELNAEEIEDWFDAFFEVEAPSVVTTLDDTVVFTVYKMEKEGDVYISKEETMDISGQAQVWVADPKSETDGIPKIVAISELDNYGDDLPLILKGANATLTEPGYYLVNFRYEALEGSADVMIHVTGAASSETSTNPAPAPETSAPAKAEAKPTASKVLVNGDATSFEAYNINGNNYFKLRDIAKVVSETEKQFDVEYNAEVKAINLLSDKAYTAVGGEMAAGDGKAKSAVLNTSKIYKDGEEISLTAYNINGNNYFKLRDLASAFDIGVTWDGATNTVGIDTSLEYTE